MVFCFTFLLHTLLKILEKCVSHVKQKRNNYSFFFPIEQSTSLQVYQCYSWKIAVKFIFLTVLGICFCFCFCWYVMFECANDITNMLFIQSCSCLFIIVSFRIVSLFISFFLSFRSSSHFVFIHFYGLLLNLNDGLSSMYAQIDNKQTKLKIIKNRLMKQKNFYFYCLSFLFFRLLTAWVIWNFFYEWCD